MFLTVTVCDTRAKFVVDTGSAVTILSLDMFNKISLTSNLELVQLNNKVFLEVANKGSLTVEGMVKLTFKVNNSNFEWDVFVANIHEDGILGLDFLFANDYSLSAKYGLKLNGKKCHCITEQSTFVAKVRASEEIIIPADTEVIVKGIINKQKFGADKGLISNDDAGRLSDNVLIAKTLVSVQSSDDGCVPVRIYNISHEDIKVKAGDILGKIEEVDGIQESEIAKKDKTKNRKDKRDNSPIKLPEHLKELYENSSKTLNENEQHALFKLLKDNESVFASSPSDLGQTSVIEHTIDTGDARPIKQNARRPPRSVLDKEQEIIDLQLETGVIRESKSPWASPLVYVLKKDGTIRQCVDYRKLNAVTLKDAYPLPKINDCFDSLGEARYFSTLDLQSGYWQINIRECDKMKTAFVTRSGLYEFNTMPFGLCNAPGTFQRCMELIFRGLQWKTLLIYLDDIIIFSKSFETHLKQLGEVFQRLKNVGLKLKPSKCICFQPEVSFLGHVITKDGTKPSPDKVRAIKEWQRPTNLTQVRSFLGFCSYYRKYIRNFSRIAGPLNSLLEAGQTFNWTHECEDSFQNLKCTLTGNEVMSLPNDKEGIFILDTDASNQGLGAVLSQMQFNEKNGEMEERPISYASRTMTKCQRNYCVTKKEMLAVVTFVQYFKQYLLGRKFIIRTDHSALRWIMSFKEPENQMARWIEILSQFDFTIVHRSGKKHGNADFMSRIECDPTTCGCYDGQTILSELPCSGCRDCLKKHEQWSSFMENEDILYRKANARSISVNSNTVGFKRVVSVLRGYLIWFVVIVIDIVCNVRFFPTEPWACLRQVRLGTQSGEYVSSERGSEKNVFRQPSYMQSYSATDLAKIQKNDPEVGTVIKWISDSMERPSRDVVASNSPFVRHLWLLWPQLRLVDGVLYKLWYPKLKGQTFYQLIVPRPLQRELLEAAHNSKFGGHLGVNKVVQKLKLNFYWFRMRETVRTWISKCEVCGARKHPKHKGKAPMGSFVTGAPMDRIQMDIMGRFPTTEGNNQYILVIQDQFSKWVEAYPLPNQTAATIADIVVNEFFSRFGLPLEIHTDQGSNFNSNLFRELCKLLGVFKTRTTPYHPSSNGLVERYNKTLINMISSYVDRNQKDWDLNIKLLTSAYRASVHDSTGFTPNMVMLGREVNQPMTLKYGIHHEPEQYCSIGDYASKLDDILYEVHKVVRQNLANSMHKQKRNYDTRIVHRDYKIGDLVYFLDLSRKVGLSPKLRQDPWKGPCIIVEKLSDLLYRIKTGFKSSPKVIHHDRLKPFLSDSKPYWITVSQNELRKSADITQKTGKQQLSEKANKHGQHTTERPKRLSKPPQRLTYR